ncbi:hypothetical protein, partial [Solidesulfovibrio sp.]|uniref:hypothetical protein n=1 Tax=Solidesulfovibrio sp. TaxID=2910990 RepID=UPI002B3EFF05|nr:hypothetical protein [Solidesulfovibrio sp.]
LARWRAFRKLLLNSAQADLFLSSLGYDIAQLSAFEDNNTVTPQAAKPASTLPPFPRPRAPAAKRRIFGKDNFR